MLTPVEKLGINNPYILREAALIRIKRICLSFPAVALSLRTRYGRRAPFALDDKYDVQGLIAALLTVDFDDLRREEWAPQYAGSSKRLEKAEIKEIAAKKLAVLMAR